ncbi:hypothetical protein Q8A73_024390 [Channa argus]|nr:hypothetical protein Q8A73_024390 [Channa argus]
MAFANQGRTIPRVGLRRTLRFQWRSSDREVMPRDLFCTRIIKGQLNLTHDMCGTHKVSGPVVDSSRFCCIQMFPVLLHPDAEEAIRADASVRVTLVPEGGDLRVKLSQYADDTTLLLDSDECVVRALELFEDFGRVSGARHNIGKCTVKGGVRVVMLLRVDYQRVKGQ